MVVIAEVIVINSGSSGNGYALQTKKETLLIEAGVKTKEMLKAINYNVSRVSGCIVSHRHTDHAKFINEYLRYGFPIYMTPESMAETPVPEIYRNYEKVIGGYSVVPFRVPHNETECDGFLIQHKEFGRLLFVTDAEMCPYDMSSVGINHALIECNYSDEYVEVTDPNIQHVWCGHMELQTCKRFIQTIYKPTLKTVGLIHISSTNGHPDAFQRYLQQEFPDIRIWVAKKDAKIML